LGSSRLKYQPIQALGERGDESVRRIAITFCLGGLLLGALALPGGASASHLSRSDFKSASKYCKALRAELGGKAFKKAFRAKRVRGAYRRCVKKNRTVRALAPVSIFPVPQADPCTPVEEPLPVRAFAGDPCAPPAPATPVVVCDEDGEEDDQDEAESDAACEDNQAGDDEDDDSDRDDGDSDEEDD
jgi:hypothetical protein